MEKNQSLRQSYSAKQLFGNWREAIDTCNCSAEPMDGVSKWLVLARACVFSMTLYSGLIALLLAIPAEGFQLGYGLLSVLGITLAHAANNLINDFFDLEVGLDSSEDYARAQYAPHPILSGLTTRREMGFVILGINVIDLAIMLVLAAARGPVIIVFAIAGLVISLFYTAPPVRLKRIGLGEFGVFLVWGPLMTGGTYFAATGTLPTWALVACLPYALIVTAVLMGKHVDKIEQDTKQGIRTLPVIIGHKAAIRVTQALITLFFPVVIGLVVTGYLGVWCLLVLLSVPRLIEALKGLSAPRPTERPENHPVWPLWYVGIAFQMTRTAGATFVLGLVLNLLLPIYMDLL